MRNVANQMLIIANNDGKPVQYRNFIRNQFTIRGVVVAATPLSLAEDHVEGEELVAAEHVSILPETEKNLRGTCGTMRLPEFTGEEEYIESEVAELIEYLRTSTNGGERKDTASTSSKSATKSKSATEKT